MFSLEEDEQDVHKPGEILNIELTRQDGMFSYVMYHWSWVILVLSCDQSRAKGTFLIDKYTLDSVLTLLKELTIW